MKYNILTTTIAAAMLTFTAVPALLAEDTVAKELTTDDAAADGRFMDAASRSTFAEISAGDMAKDKATRDDVKDFAKMIVKDHTDVQKNLKAVTDRMNIKMPRDAGNGYDAWTQKIGAASAGDFERTYVGAVVEDHQNVVKLYEEFARSTKNADLKAFAEKTLPGLRTHLEKSLEWQKALAARQ